MSVISTILASGSRYRRELLGRILTSFECVVPNIDERAIQATMPAPDALVRRLAFEKASCVHRQFPQTLVIGSDQLVDLDGAILGKPETAENAVTQLERMSGKWHRLLTAVCLITTDGTLEFTNETRLKMRTLSTAELRHYIARDEPLDCAGSYMIERAGIGLFEEIVTDDFTAIMGLPLIRLTTELRSMGLVGP